MWCVCGVRGSNVTGKKNSTPTQKRCWEISLVAVAPPLSSSPLVLSVLVHPAVTTRGQNLFAFPVSESGCTVALFTTLPSLFFFQLSSFLSAGRGRNKLGKQAQEKQSHNLLVKARRCRGEQPRDSLLSIPSLSLPACLPPLGRASVCLCAEGFDTAIQALPLPWRRMPYKARGVKEHRVGCSHTHTCTERMLAAWFAPDPGRAWEQRGVNPNTAARQRAGGRGGCRHKANT